MSARTGHPVGDPTGPDDDPDLPDWVRAVAATVDLSALCEVVVQRDIDAAFQEHADDLTFVGHLRASVRENLTALQAVLCDRITLRDVRLDHVLAFGAVQAQLRIPQASLQRSYRVGFLAMWQEWAARVHEYAVGAGISQAEATRAMIAMTQVIFNYQDHVASQVAANYIRVDEALGRSRAHVRQQLIRGVLEGADEMITPSDLITIGYGFDAHHLAVLLPQVPEGAAGQLLLGLRAAVGVRESLVYPESLTRTVLWLGRSAPWTSEATDALIAVLRSAGVLASLGESAPALAGFRATYRQAAEGELIRVALGEAQTDPVIRHHDVGLEILLMRDRQAAASFVRAELGPLAESTVEGERLRKTLQASFRFGSHIAAAQHLGLHEHTVRNRLHKIETLLGHELGVRSTEVQVALRIRHVLGD